MVEVDAAGLEKDNKDSRLVFGVELACSCEVGLDNWLGSSSWQDTPLV